MKSEVLSKHKYYSWRADMKKDLIFKMTGIFFCILFIIANNIGIKWLGNISCIGLITVSLAYYKYGKH